MPTSIAHSLAAVTCRTSVSPVVEASASHSSRRRGPPVGGREQRDRAVRLDVRVARAGRGVGDDQPPQPLHHLVVGPVRGAAGAPVDRSPSGRCRPADALADLLDHRDRRRGRRCPTGTSAGAARSRPAGSAGPPSGRPRSASIPRRQPRPWCSAAASRALPMPWPWASRPDGVRRQHPHQLAGVRRREADHPVVVLGDPAAARVGAQEVAGAHHPGLRRAPASGSPGPARTGGASGCRARGTLGAEPLRRRDVGLRHRPDGRVGHAHHRRRRPECPHAGSHRAGQVRRDAHRRGGRGGHGRGLAAAEAATTSSTSRRCPTAAPGSSTCSTRRRAASCCGLTVRGPFGDPVPARRAAGRATRRTSRARRRAGSTSPAATRAELASDVRRRRAGDRRDRGRRRARSWSGSAAAAPTTAGPGLLAALGAYGDRRLDGGVAGARRASSRSTSAAARERFEDVELVAATDVDNPLTGLFGATKTYGPQKGISEERLPIVDTLLSAFAGAIDRKAAARAGRRRGGRARLRAARPRRPPRVRDRAGRRRWSGSPSAPGRPTWC